MRGKVEHAPILPKGINTPPRRPKRVTHPSILQGAANTKEKH
jgi:hypothetical protein